MRRRWFIETVAGVGVGAWAASRSVYAADAEVQLTPQEAAPVIRPHVSGHFIEHLGGVIDDGVWVGRDSRIPNVEGIRKQLLDDMKRIAAPNLRWPGGCFADAYHWRGNVGSGTPREFHDWVSYCNAPPATESLADERAANGEREPFRVRYWGVGNESWGCGGDMTPGEYATLTLTNPSLEAPITARIRLAGGSRMTEGRGAVLTHRDLHAANTFENPNAVGPAALPVTIGGDAATVTLPRQAIAAVDLQIV